MKRCYWALAVILLTIAPATGQQQEAPTSTIKRKAELVLVPAVVTQDGKPVTGLTAKDFVLLHNGQPEPVEVFEEIDAMPAKVEGVALPPRTVQNYAPAEARQDVVILFLDYLNSSWATRARISSFLGDMTRQFAEAHMPVSVFLLSRDGLIQIHSFASDLGNLTKAIERWQSGKTPPPETLANWASPFALMEEGQSSSVLRHLDMYRDTLSDIGLRKAEMTVDAIQQISEAYRGVPGRKKLIWMSTGFPGGTWDAFQGVTSTSLRFESQLEDKLTRAWKSLSHANISVYPIDSNGTVNPEWERKFSPENSGSAELMRPNSGQIPTNTASLLAVAEKTGGQTCTTFPTKCVEQLLSDGNHYYILGFYLRGDNKPGWHTLKLTMNQPKTVVRARSGFMVAPVEGKAPSIGKEEVNSALVSPLDYTFVPLRLSWSVVATQGKEVQVEFVLISPAGGIAVNPDDSRINLDYLAFVRPIGKTEGRTFPVTLTTWISPDQQKIFAMSGFRFRKQVALAPGRYEARVLLRDNVAKKMGTVSTLLDLSGKSTPKK
ncbi:MAG: VWA domain-containing protein [Acidobacteria bacterium]|nr:VWA domain-containing protein [Acidobacteriota bacterium]MCL5286762.1 VWA domain-containing protein [Acidobacteriota bacterium]